MSKVVAFFGSHPLAFLPRFGLVVVLLSISIPVSTLIAFCRLPPFSYKLAELVSLVPGSILFVYCFLLLPSALLGCLFCISPRVRRKYGFLVLNVLLGFCLVVSLIKLAFIPDAILHEKGLRKIANSLEEVVFAAEKYIQHHKRPPESLDLLVPIYLDSLPRLDYAVAPALNYYFGQEARSQFFGNDWALVLTIRKGSDVLIYLPKKNYHEIVYVTCDIEGWAYVSYP